MGKLLDLRLEFDQQMLAIVNRKRSAERFRLSRLQKNQLIRTDERWRSQRSGKCLICGNGPSLDEINFSKFAKTPTFTVNYYYRHESAQLLTPEFHVIIDGKIIAGIWPTTMVDDLFERLPKVVLFMDVRWLHHEKMKGRDTDERIYWVLPNHLPHANVNPVKSLRKSLVGLNVVATAISIATAMNFNSLGIAGVDGDGLFREILNMQSHFYDGGKDQSMRDFESMVKSLSLSTQNLWAWQGLVKTHERAGIDFANLCRGGILDCMPRKTQAAFLNG